jgi:hypothetical protein
MEIISICEIRSKGSFVALIGRFGTTLTGSLGTALTGRLAGAFVALDCAALQTPHKTTTDSAAIKVTAILIRLLNS